MFELEDYFEAPLSQAKKKVFTEGSIGANLSGSTNFANNDKVKVALIGLMESRNANLGEFNTGVDEIRNYLYELTAISKIQLLDFGNLKKGKKVKDTYASLQYVTDVLVQNSILPVFFGGSHDLMLSIAKAFNTIQKETDLTVIDAKIDAGNEELHSNSFLSHLDNEKNIVSIIGYQSYFVSNTIQKLSTTNSWNLNRLGSIRNGFSQIEPIFRDSAIVSLDISSIRQSESPGSVFSSPNGFYAEEVCQLANLAGLSDKLKLFNLSEYQANKDINGQSAHLCAQIVWHFILGVSQRKHDYPIKPLTEYKKIYVRLEKIDTDLVFYENTDNKRFWVEIPISSDETKVISCSQQDYQVACSNEIPDRIWLNISRYLK